MLEHQEGDQRVSRIDSSFALDHHQPGVGLVPVALRPKYISLGNQEISVIPNPRPWAAQVYLASAHRWSL